MTLHHLERDDDRNIHYEWDARLAPVLSIRPGDEVVVETRSGEDDQLIPSDGPEALERLDFSRLHALSGPIAVDGARPGDVLAVHVLELETSSWGLTMQRPGAGLIRGFAPYLRFFELREGVIEMSPEVRIPIRPFLGVMGVAPPDGPSSTVPPGDHGGNLDCRDLGVGSTLYLPVLVDGALFSCGDGHAAQGDGEVCVTAVECAMTARLRFELTDAMNLRRPMIETPDALMTVGAGETIEDAARQALTDMLQFVVDRTGFAESDAYALASIAVDLRINQVVNQPMMGVRAVLPKAVIGDV